MQKQVKQKIFKYVQSGTLMKLKHYLEGSRRKIDGFNLDFTTGELKRTPLHIACLLGDDAIVRCLLHFGAKATVTDRDGDTPLHLAARYVAGDGNYSDKKLLVDPLFKTFPDAMKTKNKWGESPKQLLREASERYKTLKELENANMGEEVGSQYMNKEDCDASDSNKKTWEEKLTDEWLDDCSDMGFTQEVATDWRESIPEYTSFDEWADRMAEEYKRKHISTSDKYKRRKETNRKRKLEETNDMKVRIEKEQELYRKRMAVKKQEVLESKHEKYQENLGKHKSDNHGSRKLRFKDIPWPCRGSVSEMVDVIMSGLPHGTNAKDKRKFVLKQQILWHPDKFMQRCHNRLDDCDKDSILEAVNALSQALNDLLKESHDDD